MNFGHYGVYHQLWTVNARIDAARRSSNKLRAVDRVRFDELQRDVAKLALVVRTLAEIAISKGLASEAEFNQELHESDFADGVLDGELDPKLVKPGARRLAHLRAVEDEPARRPIKPIVRKMKRR